MPTIRPTTSVSSWLQRLLCYLAVEHQMTDRAKKGRDQPMGEPSSLGGDAPYGPTQRPTGSCWSQCTTEDQNLWSKSTCFLVTSS